MAQKHLNLWWSTLTIKEKERIATKIVRAKDPNAPAQTYPACTAVWQNAPEEIQQRIYDHCNNDHGLIMAEWTEGNPLSY